MRKESGFPACRRKTPEVVHVTTADNLVTKGRVLRVVVRNRHREPLCSTQRCSCGFGDDVHRVVAFLPCTQLTYGAVAARADAVEFGYDAVIFAKGV